MFVEPSLERRLADSYASNKDSDLTRELSRLLVGNPEPPSDVTVRELDLLTRNIENSLVFGEYIPGVIETAYEYCVCGAGKVDSGDALFGAFHARARTFLRQLAEVSESSAEKKSYLEQALVHADKACDFYEQKGPAGFGKALSSRGEIKGWLAFFAKEDLRFSDAVSLFVDSAKDKSYSALLVEKIGKTFASRRYSFAANREYEASQLSSEFQIDLLMNAVHHMKKSMCLSVEDKHTASAQLNVGKFNKILFELTDNYDFLSEAIYFYDLACSYFSRFADEENRKVFTAINTCVQSLKNKVRSLQKHVPEKRKRTRTKRENVKRIIERELEDLG